MSPFTPVYTNLLGLWTTETKGFNLWFSVRFGCLENIKPHKAQNDISFSIVSYCWWLKQNKKKRERAKEWHKWLEKNKQNQTRQNSEQFQSRVSENNSEERVLTLCRFCSVCKTCVLLQTAVKYIWHFQDHPLNIRKHRKIYIYL